MLPSPMDISSGHDILYCAGGLGIRLSHDGMPPSQEFKVQQMYCYTSRLSWLWLPYGCVSGSDKLDGVTKLFTKLALNSLRSLCIR